MTSLLLRMAAVLRVAAMEASWELISSCHNPRGEQPERFVHSGEQRATRVLQTAACHNCKSGNARRHT
jgi:hypothetical protein